jgi:hypothetical protein
MFLCEQQEPPQLNIFLRKIFSVPSFAAQGREKKKEKKKIISIHPTPANIFFTTLSCRSIKIIYDDGNGISGSIFCGVIAGKTFGAADGSAF